MREYELEILEQYEIEVRSTRKIRGAFFCETNEGTMLLKEAAVSDRRAPLLYKMLRGLEEDGFANVDTPVFTKDGKLISTSRDGTRYMLKRWFNGRECDVRREQDVLAAVKNLAMLHQKLRWQAAWEAPMSIDRKVVDMDGLEPAESTPMLRPSAGRHLKEEFLCHNRELKKVRLFMRNKVNKGKFEYLFLQHFENMFQMALQVTKRLEESKYEALYRESIENGCLIHGDYNYHNVLLPELATTNFEHFRMDVQVQDLYYFLRKVMEKHRWQEAFGERMVKTYSLIRPLKQAELEYIALKLAYPEKFWKMANSYYHSNKAWIPEKNVEKLQMTVVQTEEKLRFLENVFDFHC